MAHSEGPAGPTEVLIKKLLNSYRRHGLGGSERSAWVDHVVTHAGDPGPERGHHLLAGLG